MIDLITILTLGPYVIGAAKLIIATIKSNVPFTIFNPDDYEQCVTREVKQTQETDKDYFEMTWTVHRVDKRKVEYTPKSSFYGRHKEGSINDRD